MNKKIYLVVILGVIITTLSQTVSFISGDHQFYESVQDKCTKCHGDIKIQLSSSANHSSSSCNLCHVKSATNHTNTKPECKYCHNVTLKLSDPLEAHTDFTSLNSQGCIACHTTYNTIVNYSRAEYIDYTITNKKGSWIISNITTIGTLDLSYNALRQGGNHEIENISCKDCHKDIFDAVSLGGHAVVSDKNDNSTQAPTHNNTNSTPEAWCRTCHNRNDTNFSTNQHSVRRTTCEGCHQAYNLMPHPGNFFSNMNTVPHLYRSLVCISCKSIGWPAPGGAIHFTVHQEPYFDVTYEIIDPLQIVNSSPASDPATAKGESQTFSITLNRAADIYWYNNGSEIFRAISVISSSYTTSSATPGVYNITAVADDGYTSLLRTWNWTVLNQTGGGGGGGGGSSGGGNIIIGSATGEANSSNISGYVFDNYVLALPGVLVQNGGYQNITNTSGYYSITNLPNGSYTFSYSKPGFDTGYSMFALTGASVENVNVIIYDTTPPAQVSNLSITGGSFYLNNTWTNPIDADFNYTWFNYSNGTMLQGVNKSTDYLNLTWSPHYTQNISAQTMDVYGNINQTKVWFNATVPNNAPVQLQVGNKTVDEGQLLNFTVSATDADNDTITYGTNATKGSLNTTTGNFIWTPSYGDAGNYTWYFNSSDNYGGISTENIAVTVNNVPLSITASSPVGDPTTAKGTEQIFDINLNRTANIIWYNNGSEVFRMLNVTSSSYTNSSADVGIYNITAIANDSFDSVSRSWNWNVTAGSGWGWDRGSGSGESSSNSISGYVFDNFGSILPGVLVQNGSYQNTTSAEGYYSITNMTNGTYNFSYSRMGFDIAYFEFTLNGAVVENANRTLYDNMSAASVSDPNMTTGNFYVNNTWVNPTDADFNYTWFRYSNDTTLQNVSKPVNYLNLTWSPHYTQNISAQTVDTSGNINQTRVWFNITIPNNAPFQYSIGNKIVNENENIQFNVIATDTDSDPITYGTNATKGSLNATTGNFSWTPGYGDEGIYFWYFNSSDGYGGVATENVAITVDNIPLSITSSSPLPDPVTELGMMQNFSVALNRTANITWYMNGTLVQTNISVISANYTNSTAGIGKWNVTASATDSIDTTAKTWNWTVIPQATYNLSGYVFDNYGSGLNGALVQNGSKQNTTLPSGNYLITGLVNGTYNFSYTKEGFNTGYLEVTIYGANNTTANKTLYDTTPAASISSPGTTTGNFYVNNTWVNPVDADYNQTWFRYSNYTTLTNVSKPANYLNLTWSPHYTQNISAQTVDVYGNVNETKVWFNTTIPNNAPFQYTIGNKVISENENLQFSVTATDADSDPVTYGTNATKGSFNTITGNFSWTPGYGDAGIYTWYFNSSDDYGGVAVENITVTVNNTLLSVVSSLPQTDPITELGMAQDFNITLNRTANVTWYINGTQAQSNISVISADYANSTAGIGIYNVTATARDGYDSVSRTWNWTVTPQARYNVSGYVFNNYGSGLEGVQVQNGSKQNTTTASGYYLITGLVNGTYNFSFSKPGFDTGYLEATINGADNTSANMTLYDTTPSASVSNPATVAGNFYVNNSWTNPADADYNYSWFRYSNGTAIMNISKPTDFLNLTWQAHYTQNISAQTVDTYGNVNQTKVWFNTTIPNNVPALSQIGNKTADEGQWLNFTISATDLDSDVVIYGTNATKGAFDTETGSFSWLTTYSDAGTYAWYFNSSDSYGGKVSETITVTVNNLPLSVSSFSPTSYPTTTLGTAQSFSVTLNRTANVTWYINGTQVQINTSVPSASYTNFTAGIDTYNVTASATDSIDTVSKTWNWIVTPQPAYIVSGYVFDNYGSGLSGVLVQNGSNQNTTAASGYYLITGLLNGTYNFSYSRDGFNTDYLEVTINGADNTSANKTIYDTTPPAQVTGLMNDTPTQTTINLTWSEAADANYYQVFRNSASLGYTQNNYWNDTGLTADALYEYTVRANDSYNNWGQNSSILSVRTEQAPDTTPPDSVSAPATATGNFYVNNTWTNPADADYSHAWFRYSNGTTLTNVSKPISYLNLTWQPHYTQNISAQTVDTSGNANLTQVWFNVTIPNNVPAQSPIGNKAVDEGLWLNFTVSATEADNDIITYGTNSTKGNFNTATGNFSWLTTYSDAGTYTWYFNSSDGYGGIASETITIIVNSVPLSITSSSPPSDPTTTQGTSQGFSVTLNRTADVTWYMNGTPIQTNTSTASAVYANSTAGVGVWNITASATDGTDTVLRAWNWTVNAQPPSTYIPPDPVNLQNTNGNFWVNHTWQAGAGNTTDSYNVRVNGIWYNGTIDTFKNTTTAPHGWVNITVWAYNSSDTGTLSTGSASQDTQVSNNPPQQASIGNKAVDEGKWLNFTVNATDLDNDAIIYGTNATKGIFNPVTGNFSWLTTYSDAGTYTWNFNSSDSYGGKASETITVTVNNLPLSISSSLPLSDPTTTQGTAQDFSITLNRTADVAWYMNGIQVQTNASTNSAVYINSTAGIGTWNITASATDNIDTASKTWNWTVISQPVYNVSGYVFDNSGSGLAGVQVQNGSKQNTTIASGYYIITGLFNGTYNFSYSKAGFNTGYLEITINGADIINANKTIYDTAPPAQVTGLRNDIPTQAAVNLSWDAVTDANYYQVFRNSSSLGYTQSTYWNDTGLTADTLYEYAVRANDSYNNWGQNSSILGVKTAPAPDTAPPSSVSSLGTTAGNFYINNTWVNPQDTDFNHTWFKYSDGTALQNISKPINYLNLTWSPHYTQNISAQTVDTSGNVNQTKVWFNATIPDNAPVQSPIGDKSVDEGQWLNLTVSAADADGDNIIYGMNASRGILNATTGSFSWLTTYSDSGTYIWYFNSSDGYGRVATETITITVNNVPLSVISASPSSDPTTTQGTEQSFSVTLNRTADVTWYVNGAPAQTNTSITSAVYTNSTAGIGTWNVAASAADGIDTASRMWNWTVTAQPAYNVSGYVFDNYGSGLGGVQVQNGSKLSTTAPSGYYLITGLFNGTYNFSYSKAGFNTGYLEVAINGADYTNANKTIDDTTPPAQITGLINDTPTQTTVNLTWNTAADANFYQVFRYSASLGYTQNNYWNDTGLTAGTLYEYTVRANDSYNNWGLNSSILSVRTAQAADTTPPASVSAPATATGNFYVNNTWVNPINADYSHVWFKHSDGNTLQNVSKPTGYLNLTWSPHYTQNISAQTVDTSGNVNQEKVWFNVTIPNNAPAQSPIGNKAVDEGKLLSFTVSANDADSDSITYGTNATKGSLNTTTGQFSWTPGYGDAGVYIWYFNSSDSYGGVASETITVTVSNIPLSITSFAPTSDPTTTQGTAQTFNITLNRTANITWYMNGTQVQTNTGTTSASYTNSTAAAGTWNVTASATDNIDTLSRTWNWTVNPQPPANYIPPNPINLQNTTGNFWVNHTWQPGSGSNTTNSYNISVNGAWYNGTIDTFKNTTAAPHGWVNITVWAYNSSGTGSLSAGSISQSTKVPNNPPQQALIGNKAVNEGQLLSFSVSANDVDNDAITYGTNATKGSFNTTTGQFSWTPGYSDAGVYIWYFNSSDGYGGAVTETVTVTVNNVPLSVTSSSPPSDPTTTQGTAQSFSVTMNRTASVTWYVNGVPAQTNTSITSAVYTNSTAGIGTWNVTASATDSIDTISRIWNWTVIAQPTYNLSGYVFDNSGSGLGDVQVQNGSKQGTTIPSGYYLITGLFNGTYNFSYTKAGFNTGYLEIIINGADNTGANKTIYDTTPPVQVTGLTNGTPTQTTVNLTWNTIADANYYQVFRDSASLGYTQNNYWNDTGLAADTLYGYTVRANDSYNNWGLNSSILNVKTAAAADTTPPASVSAPATATSNFYVNNTWTNPVDADYSHAWFKYSDGNTLQNVSRPTNYLNLTWSPHYTQNISAQTVDTTGNVNQAKVWFNVTIPNNAPAQSTIGNKAVDEGKLLSFTVSANDADSDSITYGTNATKGSFNTASGQFSWTPGYGDAGVYTWYFNSSDGYGGVASETIVVTVNNVPLSITSSSPLSDPATMQGTVQTFSMSMNRTADITWYMNGAPVQTNVSTTSAIYTNSTAGAGTWNVTASATDGIDATSKVWNWTVILQSTYNVSGYVFDNYNSGLEGVLVQNGSRQSTTTISGHYSITGLLNGSYNFSFSKPGFNTGYLEVTINGADNTTADKTIYDTTPPASISNIAPAPAPRYINWTWTDPSGADFDHVEVYIDGAFKENVTGGVQYYNASYFAPNSTHTISTRTADLYDNVNTIWVNNTAATSSAYTYVSSFQNTTGTVTDFNNARSASDSGASATFAEQPVPQQGSVAKYATASPTMLNGSIATGSYSNTLSSDNSYLNLNETVGTGPPPDRYKLDSEWNSWEAVTEVSNSSLVGMNIGIEANVDDGEAVYIQLWDLLNNNWNTTWHQLGTSGLPTTDTNTVLWYNITDTAEIQRFVNATGNYRIRFADAKVAIGSTDNSQSTFRIDEFKVIFNYSITTYQLNIVTNTTVIPEAVNRQELQLRYNVSGDNFTLQLWNGTAWNNRTTLNDIALSYRNITLAPEELIPQGASTGNAGSINNYYVLVRYLDVSPAQQGRLYLDYQRVYSE